jgi:hypothetical protein
MESINIPDGPMTVGIDGGYIRNWEKKQQHFEVIVGKSILAFRRDDEDDIPSNKCFGCVQTVDEKPKRRLFEVLKSQRVSTGFVESTVNQVISRRFCKQQQMQWTKRGAHLLLQTRKP